MDLSDESVLDLRKMKMSLDRPSFPAPFFCFSSTKLYNSVSSQCGSESTASPPVTNLSPIFAMTQTVLAAGRTRSGKQRRPFKAYPKNPLSLTMKIAATDSVDDSSNEAYLEFRQRMLLQMSTFDGKPKSPTSVTSASSGEQDDSRDANYLERRRKNNAAAKRSRDARRAKEDEIAIRAAFLEQENLRLKYEVVALRDEVSRFRSLLYTQ